MRHYCRSLFAAALIAFSAEPQTAHAQTQSTYSPASSITVAPKDDTNSVTIRYKDPAAKSVFLAGSFNNWDATALQMTKKGDVFEAKLDLKNGEYQYKFVLNGETWITDPENGDRADDNYGGKNSVLRLTKEAIEAAKKKEELKMRLAEGKADDSGLTTSLTIEKIGRGRSRVTFKHFAPGAEHVYVAGSFNGWAGDKDPMQKNGNMFTWTTELPDDEYHYKFVVNGTDWKSDPLNPESVDDNHGGKNSVLVLGDGASIKKSDERVGDGKINEAGVFHDPSAIEYFNRLPDGSVILKLRTLANDIDMGRFMSRFNADDRFACCQTMKSEYKDDKFEYFRATVQDATTTGANASEPKPGSLEYRFVLADGETTGAQEGSTLLSFAADGFTSDVNTAKPFKREWKAEDVFVTPDWARAVVWYEVFPERFRNGSKDNDATGTREWTSEWTRRGPDEKQGLYPGIFGRRYGGDIQGCIEKLDYLKQLGVGAIWFNPVFESVSLHKYDATDYRHIDEQFGFKGDYKKVTAEEDLLDPKSWKFSASDKLFLEFIQKAHKAGIKVIVDGVFNHTGTAHPAFQDVKKNGEKSRFKNWYNITSYAPFEWEGWFGVKDLPVFKEDANGFIDPTLTEHIMAVTKRWMDPNGDGDPSDGIDGWRLDVANEVSSKFWSKWRDHVKGINPDAIIMGEIWDPPAKYLRGDQFDCVMNYIFAKALIKFFADDGKATQLRQEIAEHLHNVPEQASYVMMNLMNSHDTDRLSSMLYNPGRQYDQKNRLQDLKPGEYNYKSEKPTTDTFNKLKALLPVQFSYVGSPMIYYGDEAGMWGADDPDDRKPMLWEDLQPYENPQDNFVMKDVHAAYQRVAAIRNSLPALNNGEYEVLLADDERQIFVFRRSLEGSPDVIVATNNSSTPAEVSVDLGEKAPTAYVDVMQEEDAKVIPATAATADRTRIEINKNAKPIQATTGKLTVTLKPQTTSVFAGKQ